MPEKPEILTMSLINYKSNKLFNTIIAKIFCRWMNRVYKKKLFSYKTKMPIFYPKTRISNKSYLSLNKKMSFYLVILTGSIKLILHTLMSLLSAKTKMSNSNSNYKKKSIKSKNSKNRPPKW